MRYGSSPYGRRALAAHLVAAGGLMVLARHAGAATAEVRIDNFTFSPTPLSVAVGTTVTWTNRDDIPHSIVVPALSVHSHPLDTDDSFSLRFDKAGSYDYLCGIHPHMHGQVIVQG
jgi:plastocyanin